VKAATVTLAYDSGDPMLSAEEQREAISMTTELGDLTQMLDVYKRFLRAVGFVFNGELDVVSEEE